MSDAENDPIFRRALDELRRMPDVDADAVRRVIGAAAAARVTSADEPAATMTSERGFRTRLWSAVGLAAAAAIVGFMARGAWMPSRSVTRPAASVTAVRPTLGATPVQAVSSDDRRIVLIPQQFVFENTNAHRVSVVGDFNQWNATSAPMARSPEGRLWSAMIPIVPGRHVYGFMIDDSLFVLDPRALTTRDPDLGTNASVVMVGRP